METPGGSKHASEPISPNSPALPTKECDKPAELPPQTIAKEVSVDVNTKLADELSEDDNKDVENLSLSSMLLARIKIANEMVNGEISDISNCIEKLNIDPDRTSEAFNSMLESGGLFNPDSFPPLRPLPSTLLTSATANTIDSHESENNNINYISYESELQMPSIMKLIQKDLSEPYSIYTYRYFIHNWPKLCFLAIDTSQNDTVVGAIVCKLDVHKQNSRRGYIAMLAVDEAYRRKKIGSSLVLRSIRAMAVEDADEIVLETEITNKSALRLYENLGFVRDKRLFRYYLNGVDALRLKLWLK